MKFDSSPIDVMTDIWALEAIWRCNEEGDPEVLLVEILDPYEPFLLPTVLDVFRPRRFPRAVVESWKRKECDFRRLKKSGLSK